MMRRTPKRFISAAAKGPIRPYINRLIETANEIVARDQPNSFSSGTIRMLGTERTPAATMSATKVTAKTTHA
jgi:hypothetical protein